MLRPIQSLSDHEAQHEQMGLARLTEGLISDIPDLPSRPAAGVFGVGHAYIVTPNYRIKCTSDAVSWDSHGSSDSIADRPTAAALGKGSWQVGANVYISDGNRYTSPVNGKYPTLKWDAALSKLKLGAGNAKVVFCGDSTGTGAHANGVTWVGNLYKGAFRKQLALMSTQATNGNVFGDSHCDLVSTSDPATFLSYDTRMTFGADWLMRPIDGLGGRLFGNITSTLSSISFTPTAAFDTIDIYYLKAAGYGTFTVDIGAGVLATVNCNGTSGVYKTSVTVASGTHTNIINKTTAGPIAIAGISCYKNNTEIQMINASVNGQTLNQYFSSTGYWDARNVFAQLNPDLILVALGINDSTLGLTDTIGLYTPATFKAKYQEYITYLKTISDVVLCVPNVIDNANKDAYYNAIRELASSNALNIIDFDNRMGNDWTSVNTLGLMFDERHPVEVGFEIMADEFYNSGVIAK